MDTFGKVIRILMDRRGLTGRQLSEQIGISPTSVSKILTDQSKPRQITLTRLIKTLCTNAEEEQMVLRGFTGLKDSMPDEPDKPPRPLPPDEIERVTRYLEVKSMSVAFKNDVEAVLRKTGIQFEKDFRNDPFICDFLMHIEGRRIAVDCKYNVNRDWDRTHATVKLLREHLRCEKVIIAVPYENELARNTREEIGSVGGSILSVEKILSLLERGLM